jgi:membrane associated rhomboid family serine protease
VEVTPHRWQSPFSFGGRVPWGVGAVIVATAAVSLLAAFGDRHAGSIFELAALVPAAVWRGQVWRLVTWAVIEPSPLSLLFACLFLYWFGGDLARGWGSRRFLFVYAGVAIVAASVTCLVARFDPAVLEQTYLGGWATGCAMSVAWGLTYPDRVIRIWFILPLRGYVLAWLTVGITVVYAIYSGWERFVPELAAEGSILAWLFRARLAARWARTKRSIEARREEQVREARQRDRAKKRAASVSYLRLVESKDDEPPALPPEVDARLEELLRARAKRDRSHDN